MKAPTFDPRASLNALCCAILALAAPSGLFAQVPESPTEPVPPEVVPPSSSDRELLNEQKIDQFAEAYIAVEEIHTRAAEQLSATEDPKIANQVKAQAEGQIIQAVERSGLQLDEFNRIAELMASDRDLRMKIADRVRERRRI